MEFRRATSDDAPAISRLIRSLSGPFYLSPSAEGAEKFLASTTADAIAADVVADRYTCFVAEEGESLAGYVALRDGRHLYLLFVAPEFQGRGLSRKLWELVRGPAVDAGNPGEFTVNASVRAVPVYERFGFRATSAVVRSHGLAYLPMKLTRECGE